MNTGISNIEAARSDDSYASKLVEVGKIGDRIKDLMQAGRIEEISLEIDGIDTTTRSLLKSFVPEANI